MSALKRLFAIAAVLGVVTCASTTRAQNPSENASAERLFTEAIALASEGDYAAACPKLEESLRLDPALGTQFNLAVCYEKIGRLGSAWRNLRAVERIAHISGKTAREEAAQKKLSDLRPRVPHLVLEVGEPEATIKVDGERIERADLPFYPVDPGEHAVEVTAPAKRPWRTSVTVPSGYGTEPSAITVAVPVLLAAEAAASPSPRVKVEDEAPSSRPAIGIALLGLGVIGVGAAVVTGVMVIDAHQTADDRCSPYCVDSEGRDAVSRGQTLVPINAIAWVVAAAGLGVGTFLLVTSRTKGPTRAVSASPLVAPGTGGATLTATF